MKLKLFLISIALVIAGQSAYANYPRNCPSVASVKSFSTSPKMVLTYGGVGRTLSWGAFLTDEKFDTESPWYLSIMGLEGDNEAEARASLIMRMRHISSKVGPFRDWPNKGQSECNYLDEHNEMVGWAINGKY